MQQLISFYIKNENFPFQDYGLVDRYFMIDITKQINHSKSVTTTQYPLLDKTTRIDAVSIAPGTISIQGTIGELFVAQAYDRSVKDTSDQNRMQRSIDLLERLRDNAYIVDVITTTKTYTDFIIESLNLGIVQFGVVDVQMSLKEFIAFGDEIKISDYVPTSSSVTGDERLVLPTLTLNPFVNDTQLSNEIYRIIKNSTLSEPYIITFSGPGQASDVFVSPYLISEPIFNITTVLGISGFSYESSRFLRNESQRDYMTGYVKDNLKLQITFPKLRQNDSMSKERTFDGIIAKTSAVDAINETVPLGHEIIIKLLQQRENGTDEVIYSVVNKEIFITPRYSDVKNGVNPIVDSTSRNDVKNDIMYITNLAEDPKHIFNFLRRCNDGTYRVVSNLLGIPEYGYLYQTSYIKVNRQSTGSTPGQFLYQPSFVYIHPTVLPFLKLAIENVINSTSGHYLLGKTIVWW
jgi:hypothetical protein